MGNILPMFWGITTMRLVYNCNAQNFAVFTITVCTWILQIFGFHFFMILVFTGYTNVCVKKCPVVFKVQFLLL